MRSKLALAVLGTALAASFAPVSPASAVCITWYYELTGQCSPCNTVGGAVNRVEEKLGEDIVEMHCLA